MQPYVMITGATGGLGRAFAGECAARGWDLLLTDRYPTSLRDLGDTLARMHGVVIRHAEADLASPASRLELQELMQALPTRPWMLINVAGVDAEGPFRERTVDELVEILRVNAEGTLSVTHAALRLRDGSTPFRLLTVGSLAGFYPMPYKATYAATKAFLMTLSVAIGEELRSHHGSATLLAPAGLSTTPGAIEAIAAQGLMGRLTTVDVHRVARIAVDAALRGRRIVIPGGVNAMLRLASSLLPAGYLARLVGDRWSHAQARRRCALPATD